MSLHLKPFDLTPTEPRTKTRPKEPLFSLLIECPGDAFDYLYSSLSTFDDDAQLEGVFVEVGLTRREYLEQVQLALNVRRDHHLL